MTYRQQKRAGPFAPCLCLLIGEAKTVLVNVWVTTLRRGELGTSMASAKSVDAVTFGPLVANHPSQLCTRQGLSQRLQHDGMVRVGLAVQGVQGILLCHPQREQRNDRTEREHPPAYRHMAEQGTGPDQATQTSLLA